MIHSYKLKKEHIRTKTKFKYYNDLIYAVANKHFKHVPKKDVTYLLNKVKSDHAVIYLIDENKITCGFAATLFRSVIYNKKRINYIVLDVGCIVKQLRGKNILTMLGMKEMLWHKIYPIAHLFQNTYVLMLCMTPYSFAMFSLPAVLLKQFEVSKKNKPLYEKILSSFCDEFNQVYPGFKKPILCKTWIPIASKEQTSIKNKQTRYFLKHNPHWKKGKALPILFKINFTNFIILAILYMVKLFSSLKTKSQNQAGTSKNKNVGVMK